MRILLIEDNRHLNYELKMSLLYEGYAIDAAFDGEEGQSLAEITNYDIIILDILLPGKDGLAVCRALRQQQCTTPVLLLTARDTVQDRVRGLDSGADDYLVKPFALTELLARVRALLRRSTTLKEAILSNADLTLDPATHIVERAKQQIELTARLFSVLEYLMRHPNQILTRAMIADHIWSHDFTGTLNAVEVCIGRLRVQIDDPFEVKLIETIRGVGYRLRKIDPYQCVSEKEL